MRKILFLIFILSGLGLTYANLGKDIEVEIDATNSECVSSDYIAEQLYPQIVNSKQEIDSVIFALAFRGYAQLYEQNKLSNDSILTIIDYTKSANEKRMWVINLNTHKVLFHEWVAHGKNTGMLYARNFSDIPESHQSSLGFMITGKIYKGKHPNSLKLHGVEKGVNSNAFDRGIVIHGANYASPSFIASNGHLGRSYGCPSVRMEISDTLVKTLQGGSCVFSYSNKANYISQSKYLKTDVELRASLAFNWVNIRNEE